MKGIEVSIIFSVLSYGYCAVFRAVKIMTISEQFTASFKVIFVQDCVRRILRGRRERRQQSEV
jgi:hypothetical protein